MLLSNEHHHAHHDDVLPDPINRLMQAAWLILLGGRWVVVQWMLAASVLNPAVVKSWDNGPLLRAYFILLAVTAVVTVLRRLRAFGVSSTGTQQSNGQRIEVGSETASTGVGSIEERSVVSDPGVSTSVRKLK